MNRKRKKWITTSIIALLVLIGLSFFWSWHVGSSMQKYLYTKVEEVPQRHTALLLGTSKFARKHQQNLYYTYRLDAIKSLFAAKKVRFIIASGDNGTMQYNEPTVMKNDLSAAGIPDSVIFEDFAGFRTLDSMVRSKEVFGQDRVLVVSQRFHAARALYIARHRGIAAIGFCAHDVGDSYGFKTRVREHFARIKLFFDLYVFNVQPKFLGEPVVIPD